MRKLISIIILIVLLIFAFQINIACYANDINRSPDISLNSDFAEDRVIVIFNNESSLKFKSYTKSDFQDLGCKSINDFTITIAESISSAMDNVVKHVLERAPLLPYTGVPIGEYNQTICIELEQSGKKNVVNAIKKLQSRSDVLYAIPDYRITVAEAYPNDEYYNDTRSSLNIQKYLAEETLGLDKVWNDFCTGLPDNYTESQVIRVGILDTGIDEDHPDLINNINDTLCRDFTQYSTKGIQPCNHQDNSFHGTMCAGIIGAEGNNEIGLAGVCWNIELVSLKVVDSNKQGYASHIAAAIEYANQKLDVLNLSISFTSLDSDVFEEYYANNSFEELISNFQGIVVCAAGNDGRDIDMSNYEFYAPQYESPNMIVVGASSGDSIFAESNRGSLSVDLFAPGVNICSTYPVNYCSQGMHPSNDENTYCAYDDYHSSSGTSFAAPYVTGTVALMLCVDNTLDTETIKEYILDSAEDHNNYQNECVSGGRLNAYEAVRLAVARQCMHNSIAYKESQTGTHILYCTYCLKDISTEAHGFTYTSIDWESHSAYCAECSYSVTEDHDLYIEAIYGGDDGCNVACAECSYNFDCDCNPEYGYDDATGHTVDCPDGNFSFFEEHSFVCIKLPPRDSQAKVYHNASCSVCGASFRAAHHYVSVAGGGLECTDCGQTSDFGSIEVMNLSEEELELLLSSMSEEELDQFIALLPEDALARVTAILAPVKDDERLTE